METSNKFIEALKAKAAEEQARKAANKEKFDAFLAKIRERIQAFKDAKENK